MTKTINREVTVNALYFSGRDMKTFPKEIELEGTSVTFADGLRYLIHRGSEIVRLFDMRTDDGQTYRLRQAGEQWMLLGLTSGLEVL